MADWSLMNWLRAAALVALAAAVALPAVFNPRASKPQVPEGRHEVVFWHFWGGADRAVVEDIVARFNAAQSKHFVRAIAMPGHNLELKFFLGLAGGDPPDVVNQDDPIVADWGYRGALTPLDELAPVEDVERLSEWLFPAARQLGSYDGRLYALANGLDIRALYYDAALLEQLGRSPPATLAELDELAELIAPPGDATRHERYGYVPDSRRLWAWGIVFGGRFYDPATGRITADSDAIVRALEWMASYSDRYGAATLLVFRHGDQALTGASFPLLEGRYAMIMDGQWRVRDVEAAISAARQTDRQPPKIGVCPLPAPEGGHANAGWVNGNFFVVPRGANNPQGAWEFMKFWSGFDGHAAEAARACVAGGWIPCAAEVVAAPVFQDYLQAHPMFAQFVELAQSAHQVPWPQIPVAQYYDEQIREAAQGAMYEGANPREVLEEATRRVQARLEEVLRETP